MRNRAKTQRNNRAQGTQSRKARGEVERADRHAGRGECVWTALHAGCAGLGGRFEKHEALLRWIRRNGSTREQLQRVSWQGTLLTERQCDEVAQALANTSVGNGHLTSAMDPVLCAFCAAFQVSVRHDWQGVGETFMFEVAAPRRVVHLVSTVGHMEHQVNLAGAVV